MQFQMAIVDKVITEVAGAGEAAHAQLQCALRVTESGGRNLTLGADMAAKIDQLVIDLHTAKDVVPFAEGVHAQIALALAGKAHAQLVVHDTVTLQAVTQILRPPDLIAQAEFGFEQPGEKPLVEYQGALKNINLERQSFLKCLY